jgi:hypothetical protein
MKRHLLLLPVLVLVVVSILLLFLLSKSASLAFDPAVKVIGAETPVRVRINSPHGVRSVRAYLEQNGAQNKVYEKTEPRRRNVLFRGTEAPSEVLFNVGTKQAPSIKDGKARLIVAAIANDFAARETTASIDVEVNSRPPAISVDGHQHYINQGGSELVTFSISGYWTEAGVRVGNYTFRSFPRPGSRADAAERFSLFAFPWDVAADTVPVVYARNPSGAEVTARFWCKVFPKKFRSRELKLDDVFLQKVVSELDANGQGEGLDRFLKINREMRKQNNQTMSDLRMKTEPKILWKGPFYRLGKVESFFADRRAYIYNGKKVDEQMHLGFDLSDVQASPVKAANSGRVVHAGPLGIYGNCVVIDHGYGLQSIYGHLRQIDVQPGVIVQKQQVLGKSGATGLAGGDHVHFSMQVDGVQVNPIEWWDEHWIKDRILSKLSAD